MPTCNLYTAPQVPSQKHRMRGFTMIELMVVVAIMAILLALAAPSFTPVIERWRVRNAAEALTSTVYYARSEAIKRGGGITVDGSGGWNTGWKVILTQNGASEDLKVTPAPSRVAITKSGSQVLHVDRWGMLSESSGGPAAAMDIALSPAGKGATDASAIRLCSATGGRIVQMKSGAACPT